METSTRIAKESLGLAEAAKPKPNIFSNGKATPGSLPLESVVLKPTTNAVAGTSAQLAASSDLTSRIESVSFNLTPAEIQKAKQLKKVAAKKLARTAKNKRAERLRFEKL